MQLTAHFNLTELTQSQTATRRVLANTPPPAAVDALRALCANVLEPLRARLGRPIVVSSGYRSPEVNKAVGGSATSQHCRGEAVDFTVPGLTPQQVFDVIRASDLEFDQLILEFGRWVHLSHAHARKQRGECLIAHQTAQGVKYVQASRRPANPPTLPKPTAQPGQALRPLPPTAYAPGATPLAAPNDEFSTVVQPQPTVAPTASANPDRAARPSPPTQEDHRHGRVISIVSNLPSANQAPSAAPASSPLSTASAIWSQLPWLGEVRDRLFGAGANTTKWAAALALIGFWNDIAQAADQVGLALPTDRAKWAAFGLALVKLLLTKAR